MRFELLGPVTQIETFAVESHIREIARWRKRKGSAKVRLSDGSVHLAEIHWYEAARIRPERIQDQTLTLRSLQCEN